MARKKPAAVIAEIRPTHRFTITYKSAVDPDTVEAATLADALAQADKSKGKVMSVLEVS